MKNALSTLLVSAFVVATIGCGQQAGQEAEQQDAATQPKDTAKASARPAHWGYDGEDGPAHWASLSETYNLCGNGTSQSPINIEKSAATGGITWKLDYKPTSLRIAHNEHMDEIIDNGHTIQVTVDEGSTFTFGDKTFQLKQFHFHTPSEHTIDGKNMPMEMHMVHQSEDGSLAVVGVLFKEGTTPNENFKKIISHLPNAKGESKHLKEDSIDLKIHMPADNYAYHYSGSLTTPPCSENVQWLVLRDQVSLSPDQVKAFSSRIGPNNRPTQALNTRKIQLDDLKATVLPNKP